MSIKKIGVTAGFLYPGDGQKIYSQKTLNYVEHDMMQYFASENTVPIAIPDLEPKHLENLLHEIDGFVLHGGSDVAPQSYGEKPIGEWLGDKYRDDFDCKIIDYAIHHNKPILAICRGCQILNVYFGGSLYQDLPTQIGTQVTHSDNLLYDKNTHDIAFSHEHFLSELYKNNTQKLKVNSLHHQAVKNLGTKLEPLCISPVDGIVEAFHHTGFPAGKILGLQWHPEFNYRLPGMLLPENILFNHFKSFL